MVSEIWLFYDFSFYSLKKLDTKKLTELEFFNPIVRAIGVRSMATNLASKSACLTKVFSARLSYIVY